MRPSRKIFVGATALITSQALQILGFIGQQKVQSSIASAGRVKDSVDGLTMSTVSMDAMTARAKDLEGTLRYLSAGGTVAVLLGTVGLLLVLTGLYQLAILVEYGGPRPDAESNRPDSLP